MLLLRKTLYRGSTIQSYYRFIRQSVSEAPSKKIVANHFQEASNTDVLVESIAVRVTSSPTVDSSSRSVLNYNQSINKDGTLKSDYAVWMASPHPNQDIFKCIKQYKQLAKFRLTALVVMTTMGGYAMASGPFELTSFVICSVGTGLVSAAANSINQYHEVPFDSQMSRTKNRVLVTGEVTPLHAVGFSILSATAGLSMLYFGVNSLTALLGAANLFLYTMVYTPMKRVSILNTWIGSVVGAIPPLIGWAGCAGTLDGGAWILAGILYAWQFPHFNALSWNLRADYSRAGYRMMAVTNPALCRRTALRYTGVIIVLSILAPVMDLTNAGFVLQTLPCNAYFSFLAYKFYNKSDSSSSRKLFRFSLLHLPIIMLLFLLNKKNFKTPASTCDETRNSIVETKLPKFGDVTYKPSYSVTQTNSALTTA